MDPKKVGKVRIIGGGLAGCEAAWQALKLGCDVVLYEMRPLQMTPAHKTGHLAELVCSNSMKSLDPLSAPGLLKGELRGLGSLVLEAAMATRVPAGQALAVDRNQMSRLIEAKLLGHPRFERIEGEVTSLPANFLEASQGVIPTEVEQDVWIIATGPLTSPALTESLDGLLAKVHQGQPKRLFFYDAIAPTLAADSIDWENAFAQSRYDKGGDDYVNLPLNKDQYETLIDAITAAEYMPLHGFESTQYFESCLPIEVMVARGRETLRFGPMKPVGLTDPKTGRRPWAVVQLRKENIQGTMYSMVGFQTKMKWPEQKRVFGLIPALKDVDFLRYGSVHRNTYVQSPEVLAPDLSIKSRPQIFLAGQITGVEGYLESTAMGLLAGVHGALRLKGNLPVLPPATTMIGALLHYVTHGGLGSFQPMNCNFGLLPLCSQAEEVVLKGASQRKAHKRQTLAQKAQQDFANFQASM